MKRNRLYGPRPRGVALRFFQEEGSLRITGKNKKKKERRICEQKKRKEEARAEPGKERIRWTPKTGYDEGE